MQPVAVLDAIDSESTAATCPACGHKWSAGPVVAVTAWDPFPILSSVVPFAYSARL
jgi:hypothetical protein